MNSTFHIQDENSIDLSIRLINDVSLYAKRASDITLQTYEVMKSSIAEMPYVSISINASSEKLVEDYLAEIEQLVEQFGEKSSQVISIENNLIKKKINLSKIEFFRMLLEGWEPFSAVSKGGIEVLYDWFQIRIEAVSRSFLNKFIETINFKEIKNDQ